MKYKLEDFEVLATIGQGSYGTIKKVQRKLDHKIFVWKELYYASRSASEKQSIVMEVNLLRDLQHPNIVKFYDYVIEKSTGTLFILMEYCRGGDLQQLVNRCEMDHLYLEESFVWRILQQICEALKTCHETRDGNKNIILHRDIKPANIFLDEKLNAKLGDFGLARFLTSNTNFAKTFVGTPYYMSPELFSGQEYNEKSDIWSLGCIIYELCSLRPPFHGENQNELAEKILNGQYNRIPEEYSDDLWEMITYMLLQEDFLRPSAVMILNHSILQKHIKHNMISSLDDVLLLTPLPVRKPSLSDTVVIDSSKKSYMSESKKKLEESLMNEVANLRDRQKNLARVNNTFSESFLKSLQLLERSSISTNEVKLPKDHVSTENIEVCDDISDIHPAVLSFNTTYASEKASSCPELNLDCFNEELTETSQLLEQLKAKERMLEIREETLKTHELDFQKRQIELKSQYQDIVLQLADERKELEDIRVEILEPKQTADKSTQVNFSSLMLAQRKSNKLFAMGKSNKLKTISELPSFGNKKKENCKGLTKGSFKVFPNQTKKDQRAQIDNPKPLNDRTCLKNKENVIPPNTKQQKSNSRKVTKPSVTFHFR